MFRKFGIGALLLVPVLFGLYKTGLDSYIGAGWDKLCASAKREVPLEFEIDRVRHEVSRLVPEMRKQLSVVAEEMVAVDRLKEEISVTRTNLQKQKDNILTMKKDLDAGVTPIVYDGRTFSAPRVREKLNRDFDVFKRADAEMKTREQLLDAREKSLDAAREQIQAMKAQKQDLELRVAQLEAKLKTVRLAQTRNRFQFDDGQLARCKATLAEIENRLDVESTQERLQAEFTSDPIPVDKKDKTAGQVSKEIEAYFGEPANVASDKK